MKEVIRGGITAPQGFRANGIFCGIKKSKKRDLMLIASETPCVAAGVFTTNQLKAACVQFNIKQLKNGQAQAILANSGNANCLTGTSGKRHNAQMAEAAAKALGISPSLVLTASTGVIGQKLPIDRVLEGMQELAEGVRTGQQASEDAAEAILTTDLVTKEKAYKIRIGGRSVRIAAISKGSGMMHPFMTPGGMKHATMLCFVTTDAVIAEGALKSALNRAVNKSFNMISVDGDQSTNDMVLVLANGRAKNKTIRENTPDFRKFLDALEDICVDMAKAMIRDAEGATKFVEIAVKNARTPEDARAVAMSIACSNLVKTAMYGCDPNWGRIAASIGYSAVGIDPQKLQIKIGGFTVLKGEQGYRENEAALARIFRRQDIRVTVDLGLGKKSATVWTSDLSTQYVKINSAYRT
jgi:glutamate N-acetyltransferase/amino-acid N-acetyltransferase